MRPLGAAVAAGLCRGALLGRERGWQRLEGESLLWGWGASGLKVGSSESTHKDLPPPSPPLP